MKAFIIDLAYCNGCHNCQIACKDEHVGNAWLPYAAEQPNTGHFWMKVNQKEHGQFPKVRIEYKPVLCNHCENCGLVEAGAAYRREDGLVILDPQKAGGRSLLAACPYDAVYWNEELSIAQKCTGCAHLVDRGELPHCVDLCATGALRFGEEADFVEEISHAETMHPESGCKPRVYYFNAMKPFVAGEVWEPEANEIIEGATVALVAQDGEERRVTTDDFGDFEFRDVAPGPYTVSVAAEGFEPIEPFEIEVTESLNIGDFPLRRI